MSGPADREAWHRIRLQNVGGSEVAALFDCQPDYSLSKFALWHVKAGNAPAPEVDNERVKWGLRLESPIAYGVAEDNGWTIEPGGYVHDETTPGMGCTLDFRVRDPAKPETGCLEIKNVDWLVHRRTWRDGEPPLHIGLQLQHQLACTGYTWGVVAGLVGGNQPMLYPYEVKPKLIAEIRKRVTEFWQSIDEGREPPVDGSDGAAAVIRALYPEDHDEIADMSHVNEAPEICAAFLQAQVKKKAAEAEYAESRNKLDLMLSGHKAAKFTGFTARVSITAEKPDRPAEPGEIIKGRAEARRFTVKEMAA